MLGRPIGLRRRLHAGLFCPGCAWVTIPHLMTVFAEAPTRVMVNTFLLGALFGIGGTAFGIAIRYIGFSITYAIAIGISCVLGTMFTPIMSGELGILLGRHGIAWVLGGRCGGCDRYSHLRFGWLA